MSTGLIQKAYNGLFILFFLSVISIPLVTGFVVDDKKWSETEKRVLAVFPPLPINVEESFLFPQKFEQYYKEHFGFREQMIFRYHREMEKKFNLAGTPLVLKGKGKWLFYTRNEMAEDFRGEFRLTRQQLEEWRAEQVRRNHWLNERDIHYLNFSPPNKQTIYPEFLPKEYLKTKGTTRAEQLHEFLAGDPPPFYVNVHDFIKESKSAHTLYYRTDTHWNQYGAYMCFKEIMTRVQEFFPHNKFKVDFPVRRNYRRLLGGDLAMMLMIHEKVFEENPVMEPWEKCGEEAVLEVPLTDTGDREYEKPLLKKCSKSQLKAIVFCDSFIDNLEPFLSENFGQILYLRKRYNQKNVEELLEIFQPDIVIEEQAERYHFR